MLYLITFLEGIITFLSPCVLPMIPIYIAYLSAGHKNTKSTLINAIGFTLGFTLVFLIFGTLFSTIATSLSINNSTIKMICSFIIILLGINYLFDISIIKGLNINFNFDTNNLNFFKSLIFGAIFSISWSHCITTFLGVAIAKSLTLGSRLEGILLILTYSLGLSIPFLLSALLLDQLADTFNFIKKNYKTINKVSGIFLIAVGLLMAFNLI